MGLALKVLFFADEPGASDRLAPGRCLLGVAPGGANELMMDLALVCSCGDAATVSGRGATVLVCLAGEAAGSAPFTGMALKMRFCANSRCSRSLISAAEGRLEASAATRSFGD